MQRVKHRFINPDQGCHGSLQSCIRTNDLGLIGDGTHLSYFQMLGNFSFGTNNFEHSVELWHSIVSDLKIKISCVKVYPTREDHKQMWIKRGYDVVFDDSCQWSDGSINGECCELFMNDLEIGNLVNPLGHSTNVGFGWERIHQALENKTRVDETSLFDQSLPYFVRDYYRTLKVMKENGVSPGSKGRNYICRVMVRKILDYKLDGLEDWIEQEKRVRENNMKTAKKHIRRHRNKSDQWWYDTFGIFPYELKHII